MSYQHADTEFGVLYPKMDANSIRGYKNWAIAYFSTDNLICPTSCLSTGARSGFNSAQPKAHEVVYLARPPKPLKPR